MISTAARALDQHSFIGKWDSHVAHVYAHHPDGDRFGAIYSYLDITNIEEGIVHGSLSWKLARDNVSRTDHSGRQSRGTSTQLGGILNFDNVSGYLVNAMDNGIYHVRLIDADHMYVTFVEQGTNEATLYRAVFTRIHDD